MKGTDVDSRALYVGRHADKSKGKLMVALLRAENETERDVINKLLESGGKKSATVDERIPQRSLSIKARKL